MRIINVSKNTVYNYHEGTEASRYLMEFLTLLIYVRIVGIKYYNKNNKPLQLYKLSIITTKLTVPSKRTKYATRCP